MQLFSAAKDNSSSLAPSEAYNWRIYALALSSSMGSAMFGYDSAFIGGSLIPYKVISYISYSSSSLSLLLSLLSFLPSFASRFGLASVSGNELVELKANIISTFQAGCFFGVILCHFLTGGLGRRWTLIICGMVFNIGAILQVAFPGIVGMIYGGIVLTGLCPLQVMLRSIH